MEFSVTRKEQIVLNSLKLFSLKGYLSTSLDDILQNSQISKGGFYNYFKSKEDLFHAVLRKARKIWQEKNLAGWEGAPTPVDRIIRLLKNYRDRYLKDSVNFPGGCVFITLSVELDDLRPHLAGEINEGFKRLKARIRRTLAEAKKDGQIREGNSAEAITEIVFSAMIGASVRYGIDKSGRNLNRTIGAVIRYLKSLTQRAETTGKN
jgi:TetR/AcrR family transcriptional repressor of nem operon